MIYFELFLNQRKPTRTAQYPVLHFTQIPHVPLSFSLSLPVHAFWIKNQQQYQSALPYNPVTPSEKLYLEGSFSHVN